MQEPLLPQDRPCIEQGASGPRIEQGIATRGQTSFATTDERDEACLRFARDGMIVAELEGIGPSARGRLAAVIDEAIERSLARRGAGGRGVTAESGPDASLSDQLFRARRAGASGIAVVLGPLRAAAGFRSALGPEDTAALRFLAEATRERPLAVLLDRSDSTTEAFAAPVSLESVLVPKPPPTPPRKRGWRAR